MKMLKSILLAGGALLACAAVAQAADLPTKKGAPVAPPNCYATFWTWLDSSAADCPLSYWGITFYGQVDVGGGYETNAARFNNAYPQGVQQLVSKQSHGGTWQGVPNGLSQSNIGVKWKEQIVPDWFFIGDVNFGFDLYSLQFANGPRSLEENNNLAQINQSANGDSSRAYGLINSRAYAGFSNTTLGSLTYGRHYAFSTDNDNLYDPFGGAYDFSLIGNSSTLGGGLGDTELARFNDSIRYLYADHNVRVGVLSQVGGWSAGNNSQYAVQGDVGFDWQGFSVDGVYSWAKDAVALSAWNALPPAPIAATTLKATIENVEGGQIAAKYKWDRFTAFGGWQIERLSDPSDLPAGVVTRDFNGGYLATYGTGSSATGGQGGFGAAGAFPVPKVLNLFWAGGRYAVLPNVDLAGAFYHVHQNDYLGTTEVAGVTCAANAKSAGGGYAPQGSASSKCAGNEDAVSGMVDWRPYKRLDVYGGVMVSKVTGGLANGFFVSSNVSTTAGLRFSF